MLKLINLFLLITLIACSKTPIYMGERSPANEDFVEQIPLRDPSLLPGPAKAEVAMRVQNATVVWANYDLIRKDFPHLVKSSDEEINNWLSKYAVVSNAQAAQTEFNTQINVRPTDTVNAIRPQSYGRGLVVDTGDGLLDVKGAGSNNPRYDWEDGDPRNGNMTLGEAIREQFFEEAESKIFAAENPDINVLKSYAIISPGFDVIHRNAQRENLGTSPAGMLFRQSHTRFTDNEAVHLADQGKYYLWNQKRSLEVERILRKYGITSEGGGRGAGAIEGGINIQGTRGNTILDFGNHIVTDHFTEHKVYHFYGTDPLLEPGKEFPQPDPKVALPVEQWGTFVEGKVDSKIDKPWVYSHQLATYISNKLKNGEVEEARNALKSHRRNILGPWMKKMDDVKHSFTPTCRTIIKNFILAL